MSIARFSRHTGWNMTSGTFGINCARNPFRVHFFLKLLIPELSLRSNSGLELANAFGVESTEILHPQKLGNASALLRLRLQPLKLANASALIRSRLQPQLANASALVCRNCNRRN